jgi:hypothetical protein
VALQRQLAQINLPPFLKEAYHEEQVSGLKLLQTAMAKYEILHGVSWWKKIRSVPPPFMQAFFYFSVINMVKPEQALYDSIDLSKRIVSPQKMEEFQRDVDALQGLHVWQCYKLLASSAVPNCMKATQRMAFNQTRADQAQIACALERYRLACHQYPETLNELVPQFIASLPHDIIGGQSLKYHRLSDGRFLLYSVGWNEIDDGGKFYPANFNKGDWTW